MKHCKRGKTWRQRALLLCCLSALGGPAFAQSAAAGPGWGTYVGGAVGVPNFGSVGLKAFVGQQLLPYFGWEAALTQFVREVETTATGDVRTDFWGLSGAAVGILPFNKDFSGFAKLGLMAGRKRISGPSGDITDNDLNFLLGVGARFALTPRVGLRAEYEDFHQGNLFSVAVTYKF
ncbi:MAG TPA: outer membrane beta-barrel protein [Burkholderiaceae bacterium]|nr:outer membrane beta-barrel protein [Burkholderiaceae bacterium]